MCVCAITAVIKEAEQALLRKEDGQTKQRNSPRSKRTRLVCTRWSLSEREGCVHAAVTWKSSTRPPWGLPAARESHLSATPVCRIFRAHLRVLHNLGFYHFSFLKLFKKMLFWKRICEILNLQELEFLALVLVTRPICLGGTMYDDETV